MKQVKTAMNLRRKLMQVNPLNATVASPYTVSLVQGSQSAVEVVVVVVLWWWWRWTSLSWLLMWLFKW